MDIMKIYNYMLGVLLGAQLRTPIEQLHLETGTLSIIQLIATRKMIYLRNILKMP